MKKVITIFLIAVYLFNLIGYRIIFFYAQQRSDLQLETLLDKNQYNTAELITIKVPVYLPYQNVETAFQRVDGEVNFNGKIYKYVKRKIAGGNLVLLCLPDHNKMRLNKIAVDYYKEANSLAQNSSCKKQHNSKSSSYKNILSEYDQSNFKCIASLLPVNIRHRFFDHNASLSTIPHTSPAQPPELI